ncbi:hypothetical protein [Geothrix oryzisoli]|uniref:hypothetical protein n=1 Tax=Geothrix oryzisoli TaxID=2922721 RepID=UPI001FAE4F8B|nr:hypothetical protein [Geothrix oryzisoli]
MIRRLTRLWPWLAPWDEQATLEIRLFRKVCLLTAGLSLFIVLPVNLLQDLPLGLDLAVAAFGIVAYALYRASLNGRHAMKTFCVLLGLLLNFSWFMNAGSQGSVGMFLFAGAMVLNIFFRGLTRWLGMAVFIVNGLALLWLERVYPKLVVPYSQALDRQWDLMTSFVVSTLACVLVLRVVLAAHDRERQRLTATNAKLEQSLAEIRTLQGLLPICGWCKKIRDDAGLWTQVEQYLAEHTDAAFTHGMCPDCAKIHFPGRQAQEPRPEGQDQPA